MPAEIYFDIARHIQNLLQKDETLLLEPIIKNAADSLILNTGLLLNAYEIVCEAN